MPTEQCVFLILIIHSILYMYITKYGCVFLKLGESTNAFTSNIYIYVFMYPVVRVPDTVNF